MRSPMHLLRLTVALLGALALPAEGVLSLAGDLHNLEPHPEFVSCGDDGGPVRHVETSQRLAEHGRGCRLCQPSPTTPLVAPARARALAVPTQTAEHWASRATPRPAPGAELLVPPRGPPSAHASET